MANMSEFQTYQTIEQSGVQELVQVSLDEDGLPCIFLRDIDRVFPNTTIISSYGVPIPFATNVSRTRKQPLRIPFFENRILEVKSDNSALQWSRDATADRIAADAAFGYINTVHTAPPPGILDLDLNTHSHSDGAGSDLSFNMEESESSASEEEEDEPLSRHQRSSAILPSTTTTISVSSPALTTTRTLRTVQSLTNMPEPIHERTPFTRDTPPSFEQISSTTMPSLPSHTSTITSTHHLAILEEPELDGEALPSYELIDPGVNLPTPAPEVLRVPAPAIDDPSERHLVRERVEIIKRISQTILNQKYGAESCPHPPLFIILPENPTRWSFDNILHNKMRLHFLCSCCEHQIHESESTNDPLSSKRNVHVDLSKGFELRMDQFQDQMLLIKFGHYILNLLRMLEYGVSLDDVFVPSAFDRPIPPLLSSAWLGGKAGMDPNLFFRTKQNIERSIMFMEILLGDDYEEEAAEAVNCLDMNDFRILDWIIKRPPYVQSSKSESASVGIISTSSASAGTTDMDKENALHDVHIGGSGLYKVLGSNGQVRWGCEKHYQKHHQNLDKIFSSKLELLQVTLNHYTRSSVFLGTSENHLNTRIIAISKIRALFHVDFTIDWDFEKAQLNILADLLKREATSVSSVAVRLSKRVPPLVWNKHSSLQTRDDHQPISAIINLIKNRGIKHLILEGDIDLMSVPNIGTMDFTNLDILSIMRTNNRSFSFSNGAKNVNSSGSSIHSNDNHDTGSVISTSSSSRGYLQEAYIPELMTFMQSCSFLTELVLGFPDSIPGHIRILQACATGLTRLKRLDLFRVLGTRFVSTQSSGNNGGTKINRKLELSASLSACRITRLYMAECKANGEGKLRLLESLEDLLTDDGAHLEELELRFIGFNDKHAHALELGTRPISEQHSTRLRRLVIHGNGLEHRGVYAMRRILKRATRFSKLNRLSRGDTFLHAGSQVNGNSSVSSSTSVLVAAAVSTAAAAQGPEASAYGNMWEQPTLTHLELCSIDSLTDSDWANLLGDLDLQRLITLDLQGVWFGDRAVAALAKAGSEEDDTLDSSSPLSDTFTFSSYASSPPTSAPPPAFFSESSPLPLQTLRLTCSALSHDGVAHLQGFLSRLVHLSAISLHGFRKVTSEHWANIMARISFRWIEIIEIVSSGYDDECARYLGERIRAREQIPESPTTLTSISESAEPVGLVLPAYSSQAFATATTVTATATTATTVTTTTATTSSSPGSRVSRRESLSSRLFGTIPMNSSNSNAAARQKAKDKEREQHAPTTPVSSPLLNTSQKYLEIDLRYTDVSTKGLGNLRSLLNGHAKKVVVRMRDEEDGDEDMDELARLTAKLNEDKESDEKSRRNGKTLLSTRNNTSGGHSNNGPGASQQNIHGNGNGYNQGGTNQQAPPNNRTTSTLSKWKSAFKRS
ncbi:hypothetical protein BGX27_006786 [Mortierella sp. AM989]|nr:hypothetical protein BGX27_006786 [Mortierella sp. AM989]